MLKVVKSAVERRPRELAVRDAFGMLKIVCWPELVMVKSVPLVEVAKVTAPLLVVAKPVPMAVIVPEPPVEMHVPL